MLLKQFTRAGFPEWAKACRDLPQKSKGNGMQVRAGCARRGAHVAATRASGLLRDPAWRHPAGESAYPTELFFGSIRDYCGLPALAMPITFMTAPSVITPRSANQLRKAKQLSGTATTSNKSRFMVSVPGFPAPCNSSPPRRADNAVQKI